ncbi:c-type cytochrome [Kribbella endophytica]
MRDADRTAARPWRRGRLAKALVVCSALVTVGLAYTVLLRHSATRAERPQSQQIEEGRRRRAPGVLDCGDRGAVGVRRIARPGPAVPAEESYDVANATQEEIVRGGELFRTNCTACRNFAGRGGALPHGRYAPSLMQTRPRNMYQTMPTGPQQMPVFSDQVLLPQDNVRCSPAS